MLPPSPDNSGSLSQWESLSFAESEEAQYCRHFSCKYGDGLLSRAKTG